MQAAVRVSGLISEGNFAELKGLVVEEVNLKVKLSLFGLLFSPVMCQFYIYLVTYTNSVDHLYRCV